MPSKCFAVDDRVISDVDNCKGTVIDIGELRSPGMIRVDWDDGVRIWWPVTRLRHDLVPE